MNTRELRAIAGVPGVTPLLTRVSATEARAHADKLRGADRGLLGRTFVHESKLWLVIDVAPSASRDDARTVVYACDTAKRTRGGAGLLADTCEEFDVRLVREMTGPPGSTGPVVAPKQPTSQPSTQPTQQTRQPSSAPTAPPVAAAAAREPSPAEIISRARKHGFDDLYGAIGWRPGAPPEAAQKRARQLTRAVHPDKCNLEGAEEATKIIMQAAEVLGDPLKAREHERARVAKRAREQEPEVRAAQRARQQQQSGPSRDKPGQSKQQRRRERQGQNKRQ